MTDDTVEIVEMLKPYWQISIIIGLLLLIILWTLSMINELWKWRNRNAMV